MIRYLSAREVVESFGSVDLVGAIEKGLHAFAAGRIVVPLRQHIGFSGNTLLSMPAIGEDFVGVKIVSVVPSNLDRSLPSVCGMMVLNDRRTGRPLALFDAGALTALRTGALGGVAIRHITPERTRSVGIIGAGVQATWQAIFACKVRNIETIFLVSRSDHRVNTFKRTIRRHARGVRISRCADAHELLKKTDVVIAATNSSEPVLPSALDQLQGKHFIGIGSYKPSMQELPSEVYSLAETVVVDSAAAASEAGDLIQPLSNGSLLAQNIVHLADLVSGKRSLDTHRTTAFKSVGMALYDLYVARTLFLHARRFGKGVVLKS